MSDVNPPNDGGRWPAHAERWLLVGAIIVGVAVLAMLIVVAVRPVRPVVTSSSPAASASPSAASASPSIVSAFYVADRRAYVMRVSRDGQVSIVAGAGYSGTPMEGPATNSPMSPVGLAVDKGGNIYVADSAGYVEKITPDGYLWVVAGNGVTDGAPSPGPAEASPIAPVGIAVDGAGDLLVADKNGYIERITPAGQLSVIAGVKQDFYSFPPVEGPASKSPLFPTSVAVDGAGNVFVGDRHGYIAKITPGGTLSFFAGTGDYGGGHRDRGPVPALQSSIYPAGLAIDLAGNVYVANGVIDKITPGGVLTVVAGNGTTGFPVPGPAVDSYLAADGLAVDRVGTLYLADLGNIDQVTVDGVLSIVAGTGDGHDAPDIQHPPVAGPATDSPMRPVAVAV